MEEQFNPGVLESLKEKMESRGWIDTDEILPPLGKEIRLSDGFGNVIAIAGEWKSSDGTSGRIYQYCGDLDAGPKTWWKPLI